MRRRLQRVDGLVVLNELAERGITLLSKTSSPGVMPELENPCRGDVDVLVLGEFCGDRLLAQALVQRTLVAAQPGDDLDQWAG